jgi:hypothetical protein
MESTQISSRKNSIQRRTRASKGGEAGVNQDEHIAVAAYYRAEARNFEPGYEMDDWLAAEEQLTTK